MSPTTQAIFAVIVRKDRVFNIGSYAFFAQEEGRKKYVCSNFSCKFVNPNYFFNYNYSNALDLRNLHGQVNKAFCFKNCSDLLLFE
jgi:hypothetical protein